ncbi:unnamed protein product [Cylicocyclus nassatus]|uniref:WD_REPEATS_REGION domain-containing protein n=1 Tax=Cylicocyclus nassatus TaxID=53992 RepID=A0AA36M0U9_CYLNA|nr:unnamed protein product [Cylicocyclus nassatus]
MQLHKNTTAEIACCCGNCSEQETLVDHYSEFGGLTHPTLPLIWIDEGVDSMKYFPMEQIFLQFPLPEEPQPRHNPWERLLPEPEYIPFHREQLDSPNSSETESDEIEEDGEAGTGRMEAMLSRRFSNAEPSSGVHLSHPSIEADRSKDYIMVVPDDNIDIKDDFIVEDDEESLRTAKWNVKMTLRSHLDSIRAMQFHPVEPVLITAGEDGTAKLWNLDGTKEKSGGTTEIEPVYTFRGHLGPVLCMDFLDFFCMDAVF